MHMFWTPALNQLLRVLGNILKWLENSGAKSGLWSQVHKHLQWEKLLKYAKELIDQVLCWYMWVEINGNWNLFRIYLILSNGRWYRDKKEFKNWLKNLMWIYIDIKYMYLYTIYIYTLLIHWWERERKTASRRLLIWPQKKFYKCYSGYLNVRT